MKAQSILTLALAIFLLPACSQSQKKEDNNMDEFGEVVKVVKSDEEWKKELDSETYHITREKGTERAFTGKYYKFDEDGVYRCSNCGHPLFKSEHKYESGSGWPSFFTVYDKNSITEVADNTYGMRRVEVVCKRCDAHLGHVFEDGPQPTGLRYCINSPSLEFDPEEEK